MRFLIHLSFSENLPVLEKGARGKHPGRKRFSFPVQRPFQGKIEIEGIMLAQGFQIGHSINGPLL
jgi:hypothetical protein